MAFDPTLHTLEKPGTCSNATCRRAVKAEYDGKLCYPCAVKAGLVTPRPNRYRTGRRRTESITPEPEPVPPVLAEIEVASSSVPATSAEFLLSKICIVPGCLQARLAGAYCLDHMMQQVVALLPPDEEPLPEWIFPQNVGDQSVCQWRTCSGSRLSNSALCASHNARVVEDSDGDCTKKRFHCVASVIGSYLKTCSKDADATWLCDEHQADLARKNREGLT